MPIAPFIQGTGPMTRLHFRNGVLDAWLTRTLRMPTFVEQPGLTSELTLLCAIACT